MKKRKLIALVLSVVFIAAVFNACGGNDMQESTNPNASGVSENGAGKAEYAVILKTLSNDFWAKMKTGIEEEAKKLGVEVDIFAAQNEEDTAGQLTILENCLTKGYKAVGVAPLSPTNLINGIVQANEKGIYIMNIDEKIDVDSLKNAGGSIIAFATTDNVSVGEKGAEYIISQLGEDGGEVAIIEGKAGNASGESRKQGATTAFRNADDIDLVASQPADWDRQKALDTATSFIQMHPDLAAIYCCNDTMALGALQAVINADKLGKIIVVGTDGSAEALESIRAGQLSATVAQNPAEIGATSLREMVEAAKNKPGFDPNATPKTIPVDSYVVTKENVK